MFSSIRKTSLGTIVCTVVRIESECLKWFLVVHSFMWKKGTATSGQRFSSVSHCTLGFNSYMGTEDPITVLFCSASVHCTQKATEVRIYSLCLSLGFQKMSRLRPLYYRPKGPRQVSAFGLACNNEWWTKNALMWNKVNCRLI